MITGVDETKRFKGTDFVYEEIDLLSLAILKLQSKTTFLVVLIMIECERGIFFS